MPIVAIYFSAVIIGDHDETYGVIYEVIHRNFRARESLALALEPLGQTKLIVCFTDPAGLYS